MLSQMNEGNITHRGEQDMNTGLASVIWKLKEELRAKEQVIEIQGKLIEKLEMEKEDCKARLGKEEYKEFWENVSY